MLIVPIVSVLLLGSSKAAAQSQVTLRYQPPIGKTYRYRMSVGMTMAKSSATPAMGMTTSVDVDTKALSRTGDVTTVETRTSHAKVTGAPGTPMSAASTAAAQRMSGLVVQSKFDRLCHVLGMSKTATGLDAMTGGLQTVAFPSPPLKIGDSWSSDMEMAKLIGAVLGSKLPGAKASGRVPITYRLVSLVHLGGEVVANIHVGIKGDVTINVQGQVIKMHLEGGGVRMIYLSSGATASSAITMANTTSAAGISMVQHMTQSMTPR